MRYALFTASLLASTLMLASGCGKATEVAQEKAIEAALSQDGVKADVELDSRGDAVSYTSTTDDGTTMSAGDNVKLPEKFPADIPVVEGWKIQLVTGLAEKNMFNVMAVSQKKMDEVADFYKKELAAKGWKEITSTSVPGMMRTAEYEKENRATVVIISSSEEGTLVNLSTGDK